MANMNVRKRLEKSLADVAKIIEYVRDYRGITSAQEVRLIQSAASHYLAASDLLYSMADDAIKNMRNK